MPRSSAPMRSPRPFDPVRIADMMARKTRSMRAAHDGIRPGRVTEGNPVVRSKDGCDGCSRRSVPVDGVARPLSRASITRSTDDARCSRSVLYHASLFLSADVWAAAAIHTDGRALSRL